VEPYKTPLCKTQTEFTEKKSRFICHISPVSSEEEALLFLDFIRKAYRDASHNVYAYRIKTGGICRHSDDGEPSGTAGMPLLDVFIRQEVYDFCCVATRYFGGVLLGAGGLVRAYTRCAAAALDASGLGVLREVAICSTRFPYTLYEGIKRQLVTGGAEITFEDFGADVELKFSLSADGLPVLQNLITELTAGSVQIVQESVSLSPVALIKLQ